MINNGFIVILYFMWNAWHHWLINIDCQSQQDSSCCVLTHAYASIVKFLSGSHSHTEITPALLVLSLQLMLTLVQQMLTT